MYAVVRIDIVEGFKITRKKVHTYTKQSNVKETIVKYYQEIKAKYPDRKVFLTTTETAAEATKKYKEFYDAKELVALGLKPRVAVGALEKKLSDTYAKHFAKEICGRR